MHVVMSDHVVPQRLTCSSCTHWEHGTFETVAESGITGRCGRFGELRLAESRPRCNICWEPAAATASDVEIGHADG